MLLRSDRRPKNMTLFSMPNCRASFSSAERFGPSPARMTFAVGKVLSIPAAARSRYSNPFSGASRPTNPTSGFSRKPSSSLRTGRPPENCPISIPFSTTVIFSLGTRNRRRASATLLDTTQIWSNHLNITRSSNAYRRRIGDLPGQLCPVATRPARVLFAARYP